MSNRTNYFIKEDYNCNIVKDYNNSDFSNRYWNKKRIKDNFFNSYYIYKDVLKIISDYNIRKIIDIGCGPGFKLSIFNSINDIEITVLDSNSTIEYFKSNFINKRCIPCDIEKINNLNLNEKFELVLCVEVIEHLENPDNLLEFIKKISTLNTIIIISTPERDICRGKSNKRPTNIFHVREWNFLEFEEYLKHNNFIILDHKLLPPLKPNFSMYFIKHLLYSIFTFRGYIFKGTQMAICKIKS